MEVLLPQNGKMEKQYFVHLLKGKKRPIMRSNEQLWFFEDK